ncbi:uncharacterized protein CC84DRAFT_1083669 [Paraphaeosphaeria sporulosa]|uniref:Non-reducing end beta-L-arabinofuranosidase-like GH127 catalytic domain-containing protein n=1 Tax=Paraphaeosphaeria sporulosa TaxID=1460663 RepID=A0A177CQ24_9PLEO|nr:uncharacterized protein CC84DRAFT_1083669 [Paraphaeosphaeria sporulosa]OAG09625.1 hypothetical protein CC84DRAFT_1083669 [Paraphaeosphaeria sporulosa]
MYLHTSLKSLGFLALPSSLRIVIAQTNETLVPFAFKPLPLGSIKPNGWLKDQLTLSANGLAGHQHDFYDFVAHSTWLGGTSEYSSLREGFPYWFNGLVPLAYTLEDERLLEQVHSAADYVLEHQQEDGWLGPETGSERNFWGRMPVLLGLKGLAEAEKGGEWEERVVDSLWKFMEVTNTMLRDNFTGYHYHEGDAVGQGDEQWGRVRVQDMLITLQWLYEEHSASHNASQVMENMQLLIEGSLDWADWYNPKVYIKEDLNTLPVSETEPLFAYEHGVNVGQGLKALAVFRRVTHNDSLVQTSKDAVDWTFKYHAAASGAILADERLAGLAPYYGSETCTLVETMYSLSYLYQALGDASYADRCEKTAFNALPVQLTPDWWARQYVSQPNQPYAQHLDETPFWNVNQWGQSYGLEVDYPCCTVNHPQGYPKFAAAMYVQVEDNGIAHALLGPGSATVGDTMIDCETEYPFSDTLIYTITTKSVFDFHVRVPSWADTSKTTISMGSSSTAVNPDPQTGLHKISIPFGTWEVIYTLSTPSIIQEPRANDTVAIHYGALVFALAIPSTNSSSRPKQYGSNDPLPEGYAPTQALDYSYTNTSAWNYAIDPSTLIVHRSNDTTSLANPIFAPGAAPLWMSGKACEIEWGMYKGVPDAPPTGEARKCVGDVVDVRLEPLGGAKVHMVDLPVLILSEGGSTDGEKGDGGTGAAI